MAGNVLGIADAEDLRRRVVPETPGRKGDRGHQGFQMARWQIDDKPPDLTLAHRSEFRRDHFDVPVCQELGLRVELAEAALREITEIRPQDRIVFVGRKVLYHSLSPPSRVVIRWIIRRSASAKAAGSADP